MIYTQFEDPDNDTIAMYKRESPLGVSWMKVSYSHFKNLRKHVVDHEEGKWEFLIH